MLVALFQWVQKLVEIHVREATTRATETRHKSPHPPTPPPTHRHPKTTPFEPHVKSYAEGNVWDRQGVRLTSKEVPNKSKTKARIEELKKLSAESEKEREKLLEELNDKNDELNRKNDALEQELEGLLQKFKQKRAAINQKFQEEIKQGNEEFKEAMEAQEKEKSELEEKLAREKEVVRLMKEVQQRASVSSVDGTSRSRTLMNELMELRQSKIIRFRDNEQAHDEFTKYDAKRRLLENDFIEESDFENEEFHYVLVLLMEKIRESDMKDSSKLRRMACVLAHVYCMEKLAIVINHTTIACAHNPKVGLQRNRGNFSQKLLQVPSI